MALGSERLDLGVHFHGAAYAVEVKTLRYYEKIATQHLHRAGKTIHLIRC